MANPTKSGLALSNFQNLMEFIFKDVHPTKSGQGISNFKNLMEQIYKDGPSEKIRPGQI